MDKNNFSDKPEANNKTFKKSLKEKLFIKSLKPRMPKMNGMKIAYALAILLQDPFPERYSSTLAIIHSGVCFLLDIKILPK